MKTCCWRLAKVGLVLFVLAVLFLLVVFHPFQEIGRLDEFLPATSCDEFGHRHVVTIEGYDDHAMEPFISRDGQYLFWNNLNHRSVNTNLFYARRRDDYHFVFAGEVEGVNGPKLEGVASLDDSQRFYFTSTRRYAPKKGSYGTLFRGYFAAGVVKDVERLPETIDREEFGWLNMDCEATADGCELFISSAYFRAYVGPPRDGNLRLARAKKEGYVLAEDGDVLLATVNTSCLEYAPCTSADGLELYFTRAYLPRWLGAKHAQFIICRARRANRAVPFGPVEWVRAIGDGSLFVEAPTLSGDGRLLYYHERIDGRFRICCVSRRVVESSTR